MRKGFLVAGLALALAMLSACGTAPRERAASGAGIGAGTGALVGAAFGGVGAIPGAMVGGMMGGGTGALTEPHEVNLGRPVWQ